MPLRDEQQWFGNGNKSGRLGSRIGCSGNGSLLRRNEFGVFGLVDIADALRLAALDLSESLDSCFGVRVIETCDFWLGSVFAGIGKSILRNTRLLGLHLGSL